MSVDRHRGCGKASASLAIITVSDTRTAETDSSGAAIRELCEAAGHRVAHQAILPDEPEQVSALLRQLAGRDDLDAIVLTGGTGLSSRDGTYEAVSALLDRTLDGFGELFRYLSFLEIGPAAMLSRAVAGVAAGKIVFSLPGSEPAVRLAMQRLILPELGHILGELRR